MEGSDITLNNPLVGMSLRDAQGIFDAARAGNYCLLQYIYNEIERTDYTLLPCVERRSSATAGLGWHAVPFDNIKDRALVDDQLAAITEAGNNCDNLEETIAHLGLGFFRGYSHVSPYHDPDGMPARFDLLKSWNFCRDHRTRQWFWNPGCSQDEVGSGGMTMIPEGDLVTVDHPRAIDYPAMFIYIRHALAERDWGRFLERYGIPSAIVIMPEVSDASQAEIYRKAAEKIANTTSGALPYGSSVQFASEARGSDPFTAFITHQEKLTVLMATGGTLTSLAEAGSGTLAGNAQMEVWEQIVQRDAVLIGRILQRSVFGPMLRKMFPGREIAARFEIGKDQKQTPSEILDLATKAYACGYQVNKDWLESKTGLKLEKKDPPANPQMFMPNSSVPPPPAKRPFPVAKRSAAVGR